MLVRITGVGRRLQYLQGVHKVSLRRVNKWLKTRARANLRGTISPTAKLEQDKQGVLLPLREALTGIGNGRLSFLAMAFSALWFEPVDATYSMSSSLIFDAIGSCSMGNNRRYEQECAECDGLESIFSQQDGGASKDMSKPHMLGCRVSLD